MKLGWFPNPKHGFFALMLSLVGCASAAGPQPFADIHMHWKWNQREVTTPAQAKAILQEQNIDLAVVTGTPPELALELRNVAPDIVIPIYGIYRVPGEWATWHRDEGLVARVREALESGDYQGIGEVHLIGGFISDWKKPIIRDLFELAAEYDGKVNFVKLNTDENPQTSRNYNISGIPTLGIFMNGRMVDHIVGAQPKPFIVDKLNYYLQGVSVNN